MGSIIAGIGCLTREEKRDKIPVPVQSKIAHRPESGRISLRKTTLERATIKAEKRVVSHYVNANRLMKAIRVDQGGYLIASSCDRFGSCLTEGGDGIQAFRTIIMKIR